jgi:hypothetical protein
MLGGSTKRKSTVLMIYRFNKQTLQYERLYAYPYVLSAIGLVFLMSISRTTRQSDNRETDLMIVESDDIAFSVDALRDELKRCGVKFPDIVLSQAVLETGNFTSDIFMNSNNLFGMKLARSRNTTANGERRGHAYYDSWQLSVQDYSLYQTTYLRKIKTEKQYLRYLSENYAEDPNYVTKLNKVYERLQQGN